MDSVLLADDALVDVVFHPRELLRFGFEHTRDRNARPALHDACDVLGLDCRILWVAAFAPCFHHLFEVALQPHDVLLADGRSLVIL